MKMPIFCFTAILILAISVFFITCSSPTEPENPQLNVNPTSCTFTKNVNIKTLIISNSGSGELSWEITDKPDWLEPSKNSGKITTGNDTVIVIANVNRGLGTYSGTISIESNDGNQVVTVSLEIAIWNKMEDMPTARWGHSSSVLDGKIYAIGGSNTTEDPAFAMLEVYDPILNIWTPKANMSTARANFSSCVLNGKIYAIGGGRSFFWNPLKSIEEYDPETDTWTHKTDMPRARMGLTASVVNGKIYIIGGADAHEVSFAEVDVYDPATNTWTTKADLPTPRFNLTAVVLNGKIYAIGGHIGVPWYGLHKVEEYNPETDTWTTKADMITKRKYFSACTLNGKIYVFGGSQAHGVYTSSVEEYDPETDPFNWKGKTDIPNILVGSSAVPYNGKIYVSGGTITTNPKTIVSTVYEYEPGLDSY